MAKAKADGERIMADFKTKTAAIMKSVPDGDDMIAMKNLKTIGAAMLAACDDKDRFPADICDDDGKPLLSCASDCCPISATRNSTISSASTNPGTASTTSGCRCACPIFTGRR